MRTGMIWKNRSLLAVLAVFVLLLTPGCAAKPAGQDSSQAEDTAAAESADTKDSAASDKDLQEAAGGSKEADQPKEEQGRADDGPETGTASDDGQTEALPAEFKISPQGGYSVTFGGYDEDGKYLSDFQAYVEAEVTEESDPEHPGYKKVTGEFRMDLSANPGSIYWNWVSAFDRESGISFECAADQNAYSADPTLAYEGLGVLKIENGGQSADIRMKIDTENNYPHVTDRVIVYCPEDYDGTVFQIGYISDAELNAYGSLDTSTGKVTIGQLPNIHEEMLYFAAEDK